MIGEAVRILGWENMVRILGWENRVRILGWENMVRILGLDMVSGQDNGKGEGTRISQKSIRILGTW